MKRGFVLLLAAMMVLTGCTAPVAALTHTLAPNEASTATVMPTVEPTPEPTSTPTIVPTPTPTPTPEPTPEVGTRNNPYKINEAVDLALTGTNNYAVTIILEQVIRGDAAWKIIKKANMFNDKPGSGEEYLMAKFKINLVSTDDPSGLSLNEFDFDTVSADGAMYDQSVVAGLKPDFKTLFDGGTCEGYVAVLVDKTDAAPEIVFMSDVDGGAWFSTTTN